MPLDFGVEIECFVPGQSGFQNRVLQGVAQDLTAAGAECAFEGYNHQRRDRWKIVTDGSLSAPPGYVGLEVVSPPLSDAGMSQIDIVCAQLTRMGARTNRTCGLHVHVGAQHMNIAQMRRLALLYLENEDVIDSLMPPSRRGNANARYCASLKATAKIDLIKRASTVKELAGGVRSLDAQGNYPNRFTKLNFGSHWKHGTVEFRQHSGTVDAEKIKRWVYFCQKLVDVAATDDGPPDSSVQAMPSEDLERRLRRVKTAAVIYELARRPEGVTPSEAQAALGWSNAPRPAIDLNRLGVAWTVDGTRNRQKVYKVSANSPRAATLDALLEKLAVESDHVAFWKQRVVDLSTPAGRSAAQAHDENPNPHYRGDSVQEQYRQSQPATLGDILDVAMRSRRIGGQ